MRVVIILLAFAQPALAQSRMFVGGSVFADSKKFSGDPSTNTLDGTAPGGAVEGGVILNDRVTLRVRVGIGGRTTRSTPIRVGILALPTDITAPITAFRSEVSNRSVSSSILLGYQFPVHHRVRVGALAGLSFLHVTREYITSGPIPLAPLPARIPALVIRPRTLIDNVPAATAGAEAVFDLTRHLALVPDMQVSAFTLSSGGPSGFAIRPGVGARWTF